MSEQNTRVYYDRVTHKVNDKLVRILTGITLVSLFDGDSVHIGVSRCHVNDVKQHNKVKGRVIALGRAQYQSQVAAEARSLRNTTMKNAWTVKTGNETSRPDLLIMADYVSKKLGLKFQIPLHMLTQCRLTPDALAVSVTSTSGPENGLQESK